MEFKFIDLLHLSEKDLKHLKLAFNVNWTYKPENLPPGVLGPDEREMNLLDDYCTGNAKLVCKSVRTNDPKDKDFLKGDLVFAFIPYLSEKDWLLVDVFKVTDDSKYLVDTDDQYLADYLPLCGRLVVHHSQKSRGVTLRKISTIETITVQTILEQPCDKEGLRFPGYDKVSVKYEALETYLSNSIEWQQKLKERRGIYVISDEKTGKLYVGSASGKDGIYGRWKTYIKSGYDRHEVENGKYPNKKLQELVRKEKRSYVKQNFRYTILETFPDSATYEEIIAREKWWKKVLLTRQYGYNAN